MKFTKATVEEIKRKTDLLELVGRYVRMEKRGDRYWGLSPFKSEKTASFTVQPDQGFYYCFATQQGGDAIRFVMELEKLSFPEAVEYLAQMTGVTLEEGESDPDDKTRAALLELNERTTRTFQYLLTNDRRGSGARSYLGRRGISDEAASLFRLGFAPDDGRWLNQFLKSKSYSDEFLSQTGLFSKKHPEFSIFRNRLIFPIIDERGKVRGFGGRALDNGSNAKYLNSPDTLVYKKKSTLFGLHQAVGSARRENTMVLCEGYTDVIALHLAGVKNSVAPLGTAFTDEQARLLKRWVETLVFVFDSDSAGRSATFRAAMTAERGGFAARSAVLPEGMDPFDLLQKHGNTALWEAIDGSVPVIDTLVENAVIGADPKEAHDRELILRKVFPYISIASSEVRRDSYLGKLSERLGLAVSSVQNDFIRWNEGNEKPSDRPQVQYKRHKISRDLRLMLAIVEHGELFEYLRTRITSDDLEDARAREIFLILEDRFRRGDIRTDQVLDAIDDEELKNIALASLAAEEYRSLTKGGVDQAVQMIRMRVLGEQQRDLERRLRESGGSDEMAILLQEKMAVDEEFAALKARVNDGTAE